MKTSLHYNEKDPMEWVRRSYDRACRGPGKAYCREAIVKRVFTSGCLEDIMAVIRTIDDATVSIDEAVQFLYMYNVSEIHPGAKVPVDSKSCRGQGSPISLPISNGRPLSRITGTSQRTGRTGDRLLIENIRALYSDDSLNTRTITAWREIFNCLENSLRCL